MEVTTFKWHSLKHQEIDDDSKGEHIADGRLSVRLLRAEDLGGGVAGGAAAHVDVVWVVAVSCEAEVTDNDLVGVGVTEDDVLGFQVAVDYTEPGELSETLEKLPKDILHPTQTETLFLHNPRPLPAPW